MTTIADYATITKLIDQGLWATDPLLLPALADVLEERGDADMAVAVRQIVDLGVTPQGPGWSCAWWSKKTPKHLLAELGVSEAVVPDIFFNELTDQSHGRKESHYFAYNSYTNCYLALARAIIAAKKPH